jgi:hypothetical protein
VLLSERREGGVTARAMLACYLASTSLRKPLRHPSCSGLHRQARPAFFCALLTVAWLAAAAGALWAWALLPQAA